jgi:hypothetical protein
VVEYLTLLLRIREVPGSNLDPETGCPDRDYMVFSVPPGKFRKRTSKLGHDHFLPHPFQFIIYLSSLHSALCTRIDWVVALVAQFDEVKLCLWTAAVTGPSVYPTGYISNNSHGGMNWQLKTEEFGEEPVPVPLCPPHIPRRWRSVAK